MPEGPEVFGISKVIRQYIRNKYFRLIEVSNGKYTRKPIPGIGYLEPKLPLKVLDFKCKGKFSWWEFENTEVTLSITYGLEGHLMLYPNKYHRVTFNFSSTPEEEIDQQVFFNDQVSYGNITIYPTRAELNKKLRTIGVDLIQDKITKDEFIRICRSPRMGKKNICEFLMCQKYVSGVGNYIKSDSLFLGNIDPRKNLEDITEQQLGDYLDMLKIYIKYHAEIRYYNYSVALLYDHEKMDELMEDEGAMIMMINAKQKIDLIMDKYLPIFELKIQQMKMENVIKCLDVRQMEDGTQQYATNHDMFKIVHRAKRYVTPEGIEYEVKCITTPDKRQTYFVEELLLN
jgi:formamidopyrimidine-DNA glycosylase